MLDRRVFLSGAALALLTSAARAAGSESPRDIIVRLYKLSAGPKGDYSISSGFFDKGFRKAYFSRSLIKAVNDMDARSAKNNEPILDFDPVTASQDPSVKKLAITSESETAGAAIVAAKFFAFDAKTPTIVRYSFIQEAGGWKLDDMDSPGESGWNLRKILAGE